MPEELKHVAFDLLRKMIRIRLTEEKIAARYCEWKMRCPTHLCTGQEAISAAVGQVLRKDDFVVSTHRSHGHYLGKGGNLKKMIAEIYGKATGCSSGKGGSMHLIDTENGFMGSTAIVGSTIPVGVGLALSIKLKNSDQISCVFFGDGATETGVFFESLNFAALKNLPVLFVCENNLYGASTRIEKVTRLRNVAGKASAYGIRAETLDGNDVLAVYEAARQAVKECRTGKGPVLLELMTYRITGHSRRDPCTYQPREEREEWLQKEPISVFRKKLIEREDITEKDLEEINHKIEQQLTEAVELAQREPGPRIEDLTAHVFV